MWLVFIGIVIALLTFDLGVLHKDDHEISVRKNLLLSMGKNHCGAALRCLGVVVSGRTRRHGLLHQVSDREVAVDGQRIRHRAEFSRSLPFPDTTSTVCLFLGHSGRDSAARDHDRSGRHTGEPIQLGALHIRHILGLYRHQDVGDCGPCAGHWELPDPQVTQAAPARDRGISRQCQRPTKSTT